MKKLTIYLGLALLVAVLPWGLAQAANYATSPIIPKFVDQLAAIPVATPTAPPVGVPTDADYYELEAIQSTWQFHTNLPATTKVRGYHQIGGLAYGYLGPIIVAKTVNPNFAPGAVMPGGTNGRPVRIKFTNSLSPNSKLFLPVDTNLMGAGLGPLAPGNMSLYAQTRVGLHLHGGVTPWISDGTPHQWLTPAGETTPYPTGLSFRNVPDMPTPPAGSQTLYYSNQQSGRLMFYHDHAFGITRLNVYAGLAAGYVLYDQAEDNLITAGTIPDGLVPGGQGTRYGVPLVIQDKTFVDTVANMNVKDPDYVNPAGIPQKGWVNMAADATIGWGGTAPGDLYFPHVYEFNQANPATATATFGVNPQGRWDYGGYVWPPAQVTDSASGYANSMGMPQPTVIGDVRSPSVVPEAFMDTMVVNGKAYPNLNVAPRAYRFRILNACNDRGLNLQLYYADNNGPWPAPALVNPLLPGYAANITARSAGGTEVSMVKADGTVYTLAAGSTNPVYVNAWPSPVQFPGLTQTENGAAGVPLFYPVGGLPTVAVPGDSRVGGVPDPRNMGPQMIQIGNEGGLLPAPIVQANNCVDYDRNTRSITIGNVRNFPLMGQPNPSVPGQTLNYPHTGQNIHLGPAERADVIIDFSTVPVGSTLILYNDNPAPEPAGDPRVDYYTGNPDYSNTSAIASLQMGGAPTTAAGFGPNTRTIMKFTVVAGPTTPAANLPALQAALPAYFAANQPPPLVPDGTPGHTPAVYAPITIVGGQTVAGITVHNKTIAEDFDVIWGRMNAVLGTEQASTNTQGQQTFGFHFADPATERLVNNSRQIWKVTHNGVDTHSIHVHLFNVQVVNRVDWVGVVKPPDPNEMGWKETIRMNPLEDIYVALRPKLPKVPFAITPSVRPLDPTMPVGMTNAMFWMTVPAGALQPNFPFTMPTPGTLTGNTSNALTNFGHEYVWHCHLLGHEENDMMRPIAVFPSIHGWVDLLLMF